jgi:hypothetical protein
VALKRSPSCRRVALLAAGLGLLALGSAGCGHKDPPSIARLGTIGITSVEPARVVMPDGRPPRSLAVKAALNTVYPTRDASHASAYRRFHWVEFKLGGATARARFTTGRNDDRSHASDGGYQPASTWIDQYLAVFTPAPHLPREGRTPLTVTACDRDPVRTPRTFCQRRSLPLCVKRRVVTGEPTLSGLPRPRGGSCRMPAFYGRVQSAAQDGLFFRSLED